MTLESGDHIFLALPLAARVSCSSLAELVCPWRLPIPHFVSWLWFVWAWLLHCVFLVVYFVDLPIGRPKLYLTHSSYSSGVIVLVGTCTTIGFVVFSLRMSPARCMSFMNFENAF